MPSSYVIFSRPLGRDIADAGSQGTKRKLSARIAVWAYGGTTRASSRIEPLT